jgi:hypothetical protein
VRMTTSRLARLACRFSVCAAGMFIWHGAIGIAWPRYAGGPYDIAVVAAGAVLLALAVGVAIVAVIHDLGNGD